MSSDENDFEKERRERIQRNQEILAKVGLQETVDDLAEKQRARKEAQLKRKKATKRKAAVPAFPTRRSTRSTAEATRMRLKGLASGVVNGRSEEEGDSGGEGTAGSDSDGGVSSDDGSTAEDSDTDGVDNRDSSGEEETELQSEERRGYHEGQPSRGRVTSRPRKVHVCRGGDEGPSDSRRRKSKAVRRGKKASIESTRPSAAALHVKEWPALGTPEIEEAFRKFDVQGIGLTTLPRIVEVAEALNVYFEQGQLEAMMDFAAKATGCDGEILTLQEFEGLISSLV